MGINYYICEQYEDGDEIEIYHIGKSSYGWCFALHVEPDKGIKDLNDIQKLWQGKIIRDEDGQKVSEKEMLQKITNRELGWRHEVSDSFCVGQGEGPYDYIKGVFS